MAKNFATDDKHLLRPSICSSRKQEPWSVEQALWDFAEMSQMGKEVFKHMNRYVCKNGGIEPCVDFRLKIPSR